METKQVVITKEQEAVKPSFKSVEGGSAIATIAGMALAGYYILTQDTSVPPEVLEAIVQEASEKAETFQDIKEIYQMVSNGDNTEAIDKAITMLSVFVPGSSYLGFFAKKRSDVKAAVLGK